jgi:CDP-glycerol glycerophosphotransferase (TagB/SpsB family)/glycosyltransferase involved in cell wall biosynthesis
VTILRRTASALPRRFRTLSRRLVRAIAAERRAAAYARPIIPGTVLYESFAGNGALDNPEAIFRELLRTPGFEALQHIWVLDHRAGRPFKAEFHGDRRVRFVTYRTAAYFNALARSQYLVNNATFPAEFQKRPEQIYLNTWHGTPLKTMGYDMPDGAFQSANTLRNFTSADVLLAQNPAMTRMYRESYKLDGIFRGRIVEAGYPRTDRQNLTDPERRAAQEVLRAAGIPLDGRKLVVVAPTWKGTSFTSPRDDAAELLRTADELQALLGDRYAVALKVHQAVHRIVAGDHAPGRLVPNDLPTNVILGLTDVLVTDYSSIFFDYLSTGRPIVFFTPDEEDYARERGTSLSDGLPGAVTRTVEQLAQAIVAAPDPAIVARAADWRERFTPDDDGGASRRVIDAVFRDGASRTAAVAPADHRRSVLIYLGGMRSNGITTSALNLLRHLDHSALDVSILIARPRGRQQRTNALSIDPRLRQFHLVGAPNGRKLTTIASRVRGRLGRFWTTEPAWDARLWSSEWRRVLGDVRFDTVIDFSGYSRPWAQLVLHSPPARRAIWLHNDMAAEVNRTVDRRRRMKHSLPAVFSLYRRFDELVSVSRELAAANAARLAGRYGIAPERFVSARNVIDDVGARAKLAQPLFDAVDFVDQDSGAVTIPDWAHELARHSETWFVTVGRLSPEKNHARLLESFAIVHRGHPATRLLIIGDGPLRAQLQHQADALGLDKAVVLAGSLQNPFAALAAADCFVLSSDYEGQPMVILEAAVAGLPIVTVRFGSVSDALPDGPIHVVDQTVDGLAGGMTDYLDGTVAPAVLDAPEYNDLALREFLRVVGTGEGTGEGSSDASSIERSSSASSAIPRRNRTRRSARAAATTAIHHI